MEGFIDKQSSKKREPHECNYCETSFTTTSTLMKHITDTHSENVGHKIVYFDPPTKRIKITKSLVWNFAEKLNNFEKCNFCNKKKISLGQHNTTQLVF